MRRMGAKVRRMGAEPAAVSVLGAGIPEPIAEPAVHHGLPELASLYRDHYDAVGDDGYQASPIGTGPFTFVEFRVNQYILYERVEDHWRKTPEFPELQIFYVLEDATRMAMLLTGEAHIAAVQQSLMPTVEEWGYMRVPSTNPSFALMAIIGGLYYENERDLSEPMTNIMVRQAMNQAIDRTTLNEVFYQGQSLPMPVPMPLLQPNPSSSRLAPSETLARIGSRMPAVMARTRSSMRPITRVLNCGETGLR